MPAFPPVLGFFGRHPMLRRFVATLLGALTASGCATWRGVPEGPKELLAHNQVTILRVVRYDGRKTELLRPFIKGESIGGDDWSSLELRVQIPLREVQYVEVRRLDGMRTALLVGALGATAIVVATALGGGSTSPHPSPPPSSGGGRNGCYTCVGSCPFVYSWDGAHWRLDSGTFGGAIARALQRTDVDNLDYAMPENGTLRLKLTNELPETDHVDALTVVAVDHERDVVVAPDPSGGLHTIGALVAPVTAKDFRGADALARVRDLDGWNWESSLTERDPARAADLRDGLEVAFVRPHGATRAHLVLDGNNPLWSTHLLNEFVRIHGAATQAWYDSLDAQPALAQGIGLKFAQEAFLQASVRTPAGWRLEGAFGGVGPEVIKRQVLDLDLSAVAGDTVFVRLEAAPSFWLVDRIAMDFTPDRSLSVRELPLVSAIDRNGRDVAPQLSAVDGRYYDLRTGDAAELTFRVPVRPAGMGRTFLLRSTGWYQVDSPGTGAPDIATLDAVTRDPLGIARGSVVRLNAALAQLRESTR